MFRSISGNSGGAFFLIAGLFVFSLQDNIIKYFSGKYSVLEIVFIRGIVAAYLIFLALLITNKTIPLVSKKPFLVIIRGTLGFISYTCYYLAVAAMPLAEVAAITMTMPLFVTILSTVILRERVGPRRWIAIIIGFLSIVLILSPTGKFDALAVALSFAAAISYASHTIITRFLSSHDHPTTIAFNAIVVFTTLSVLISLMMHFQVFNVGDSHPSLLFLGRSWSNPSNPDFLLILLIGLIAATGFYCLSKAYCMSEASAVAPFEYTYLIWAVVFGYLFWDEVPSLETLLGILVLVGSSLYVWNRERQSHSRLDEIKTTQHPYIDQELLHNVTK